MVWQAAESKELSLESKHKRFKENMRLRVRWGWEALGKKFCFCSAIDDGTAVGAYSECSALQDVACSVCFRATSREVWPTALGSAQVLGWKGAAEPNQEVLLLFVHRASRRRALDERAPLFIALGDGFHAHHLKSLTGSAHHGNIMHVYWMRQIYMQRQPS